MFLYHPGDSFFHSFHPVSKLLLLILMVALPFTVLDLPTTVILFLVYLLALLFAQGKGTLKKFWKLMVVFWVFAFLIWLIMPRLRHMPISTAEAAVLASRVDCFVLAGLIFVTITRVEEFTLALIRLGIPYRAAFTLSLGFRLVPLFYQNLQTIMAAQKSRGVDLDSAGLLEKTRNYIPLIGILISYALRNADIMAMALEAKGFGYSSHRTYYLRPRAGWRDWITLGGLSLLLFALYLWKR